MINTLPVNTSIPDLTDEDVYVFPTSFAQQRLWFLDQIEPGLPFYNIPIAVRLKGRLDLAVLKRSVNEIVYRHETLRTTFHSEDGRPVQVIAQTLAVPMPMVDLCELHRHEDAVQQLADEEARLPFDLSLGPLLRIRVLKLRESEHVVLLTMHHIISDAWSIEVFVRELASLYHAFSSGNPSPLPQLPIQYADFASWQREYLSGEVLERQLAYWKGQLGGDLPVLELPTDRPRPAVQTFRGATLSRDIPKAVGDALKVLSLQEGATWFMTLLAAFQVLLYRYTGQEDICVGSPIANRNRAEIEGLIGFFVNTLVLRTDLSGAPTFRELLGRVRGTTLKAYENQDLPFEMMVEAVKPQRDTSYNPLFQTMFILQNGAARSADLPGLTLETIDAETGTSTFDVTLTVTEMVEVLDASIEYNTDLFDPSTVERFLEHFRVLLESIAVDPDMPISELPLLPAHERDRLLIEWNPVHSPFPEDCIHRLFESRVELTPDAVAVVVPGLNGNTHREVTYGELNGRANQLARYLNKLGAGPDTVVGVCMEKCADMITGVLAILKAGAAYLPLDPSYPANRLSFMIEDSGVRVVLTQEKLRGGCSVFRVQGSGEEVGGQRSEVGKTEGRVTSDERREERTEVRGQRSEVRDQQWPPTSNLQPPTVLCLDADWPKIAHESDENLEVDMDPSNLAYVVYTSGSTGRPKGVLVRHRNLLNACLAWEEAYGLHPGANHLQMASFAFDVFSGDLVRALCTGGKLVLCPRELLLEPKDLYGLMLEEEIMCAEFVPAVLRNLAQYLTDTGKDLGLMRLLICGSDVWTVKEYQEFRRLIRPGSRLINSFGLAETTIDNSYFEGRPLNPHADRVVPIGRPFSGNRMYVLDRQLRPQPIGVHGELFIGGAGVARGYLNRPELTGERFVPDPFIVTRHSSLVTREGERLYRTGDMARYLEDGDIEFLGRMDHQIKIRGFRIETGEIESTLIEHPAVQEAVVIAAKTARSESLELAAYLVVQSPGDLCLSDLRGFLKARLPDYMIPSAFTVLDGLPLSPNGKVDRKGLPSPECSISDLQQEYVAPRTATEEMLAGIWGDLLGLDRIGVRSDFFDLGGHSLLATQLISRVRTRCAVEIPLRSIFEWPVLEEFAIQVEAARRSVLGMTAPPIVPVPRTRDLPLSFSQQRLWFLDQLEPGSPFYNLPEIIRLRGTLSIPVLERSLNETIRRHESLRTAIRTVVGKPIQHIEPRIDVVLPLADLGELNDKEREEEVERVLREEMETPFDLARAPLFRARILRLGEEDHIVSVIMHHIIGDEWSSNILIREMTECYDGFSRGAPPDLPELHVQYSDFAHWQRNWIQGEVLESLLAYWKKRLENLPPLLELPTDRPRPPVQNYSGDYRSFVLEEALGNRIREFCRQEGVTLFMFLLGTFQVLLQRVTGQESIAVGSPIANRNRFETEGLIGFFVNTLVLRADLSGEMTFREVLRQVRETTLEAYIHQDLPFEMVVDELKPERNLSHSPLFQVMFVLQNTPLNARSLPDSGLTLNALDAHSGTAKFDLTLFMVEEGGTLNCAMEYNTDLFNASTVDRLLQNFVTLLLSGLEDPDRPVSMLPLLSDADRRRVLLDWNDTETPLPEDLCAHGLFGRQASLSPEAVSAVFRDRNLTYGELNRRANQVARYLQGLGVGPETLVGVCLERSPEMLIGILGTLKAGAAYVPLDPAYPPERLSYMVEDSGVRLILTQENLRGECSVFRVQGSDQRSEVRDQQLPPTSNLQPPTVLCLDTDWPEIAGESDENLDVAIDPSNLAYVIYTSGSTGRPKGAMITHGGLANYLAWVRLAYPLEEGTGSPVQSSISFDLTVTSLFAPLVSGRRVMLLPEDLGVESLGEAIRSESDFSLVKITPAHLQVLGEQIEPPEASSRTRAFIIGGENLLSDQIAFWQSFAPGTVLVNEYGPTETVVGCCVYWTPLEHEHKVIPIGRPIINTALYAVDPALLAVPPGAQGELCIGGHGVARGYLHRPDLAAERFVPDDFSGKAGGRLYRTGDLVRFFPDGNIECLGRIDHQVKIRGFRVEPGEIEAVLSQHPAVREVVVWPYEERGLKRLAAYVVPEDPAARPEPSELRSFLLVHLPEYMAPSAFVLLEELPLTPNGKVDRKGLPLPGTGISDDHGNDEPPGTPQGKILADIWAQLLGLDRVGVHDNFFELGGDSILSIQLVARADRQGIRLTPRQIFEFPTIAGLLTVADTSRMPHAEQGVVTGSAPLTPVQRWFFEWDFTDPHHWNQSLLLKVIEPMRHAPLRDAFHELVRHHDALRMVFRQTDRGWEQFNGPPEAEPPLTWIDLSELAAESRQQEVERVSTEVQPSLDLSNGPLIRFVYFDPGPHDGWALIVMHHLITDVVSWQILIEDFQAAYQEFESGRAPKWPSKTTSVLDWAHALTEIAPSDDLLVETEYWASLSDHPEVRLPMDHLHGENTEGSSLNVVSCLSVEETGVLLHELPKATGAVVQEVLLTAVAWAVCNWTGQRAVLIDMEGHGREHLSDELDLSRTVGWFTTLYPVYLDLSEAASPGEALHFVKRELRRIPRNGIGYGMLRYLSDKASLRGLPNAELSFNYFGQIEWAGSGDGQFGFATPPFGERSPGGNRTHLLDINGGVISGRLEMEWSYSGNLHRPSTIERLSSDFIEALREIIRNGPSTVFEAADFELFGWDQSELEKIRSQIENPGKR